MPQTKRSSRRKAQQQHAEQEPVQQQALAVPTIEPHPMILELALGLAKKDGTLSEAGEAYNAARDTLQTQRDLVNELAKTTDLPELYTFAGYLGGIVVDVKDPTQANWQILYLDAKLLTWLLVDQEDIVATNRVDDDTSPFGSRNYVWLKSDASVSQGEGPPQKHEIEARYLRGDFVSAADFAASVTGGTFAPVTGPLCPLTPGCCGKRTK